MTLLEKTAEIYFVEGFLTEREALLGRPLTEMEKEALLPVLKKGWQAMAAGTKAMAAKATNAAAHPTFQAASRGFSEGMMTGIPSNAITGAVAPLLGRGAKKGTLAAANKLTGVPGTGSHRLMQKGSRPEAVRINREIRTGRALRKAAPRVGSLTQGLTGAF